MRLGSRGYPLIILSHRKQEFLETAIRSLRCYGEGITEVIVVDDSGDANHHDYLDGRNIGFSLSSPDGSHVGYLGAMQTVWETARDLADVHSVGHVMLWEEDFALVRPTSLHVLAEIMNHPRNERLAQLNLQRQPCYAIERRFGYMESHQRRGYGLDKRVTASVPWVQRRKPFTTNPGLIRRKVLDSDWPTRVEADKVPGGAEPAMSRCLESQGWHFGWFGMWNTPSTKHMGDERKTGIGY